MKDFLFYIALGCLVQFGTAQPNTGSITGTVSDAKTLEPLAGVNVLLQGTVRGTVTNVQGKFQLNDIPAGTCTIICSLVGYTADTIRQINIEEDKKLLLDIQLVQSPIKAAQVVVTASRREQSLQEVPVSISTVSSKAIADHVAVTLDEALRYIPGVNMMADQVNIRGSSGYSRGTGSRALILIDGLPDITGDTGEITWETIPMFQIDRIEVVKGAGSSLYGSSALGGVINVITKEISDIPEVHVRLFSGLYDSPLYPQWKWSSKNRFNSGGYFSYSNRIGSTGYLVSVSRSVDESFRENDVYHRWGLYTKFNYHFTPYRSITLTTNVQWRNHGNYFWWKSLIEATRPADSQLGGEVNSTRGNVNLSYKEILSEKLFYTLKSTYVGNFWQDLVHGRVDNTSTSHFTQVEGQAIYSFMPDNLMIGGVVLNYDRVYSNIFGSHPGIGTGVYIQDEYKPWNELQLTAGFRYDWQRIWKQSFSSPIASSPSQINPKIGVTYSPCQTTTFRGSYGEGFRYPSMSELFTSVTTGSLKVVPNDSLKPERSISYEIGGSQWLGEGIFIDLALFQNDFYDLVEAGVNPKQFTIQFNNVTRARIRGLESGLKTDLFHGFLTTDMSYTTIDPVDLTNHTVLRFRPRNLFYASLKMQYKQLETEFNYRYVSRVEAIDDNLVNLAPIVDGEQRVACSVIDTGIRYTITSFGPPLNIGLMIKNLTNYYYVELMGNLAPLRTFYLTLEGAW